MTWWTCWSWTQSKIAPDSMRKMTVKMTLRHVCLSVPLLSFRMTEWLDWWMRGGGDRPSVDVHLHWSHFCTTEKPGKWTAIVELMSLHATVPFLLATHACCIGLYLSPPSPLIGYSCVSDDFRLQKQRAVAVVLNYPNIAHWSRH